MGDVMESSAVSWGNNREHALVVAAYISWYRQTQDETYCAQALDMLQHSVPVEEMCPAWAAHLFFAYEQTGDENWRVMIEQMLASMQQEPANLTGAYDMLPFRMAYEMKLNRMAWVSRVAASFKNLHEKLFEAEKGVHRAGEGEDFSAEATAWFLLALVDAIEICDQQLYEHWRTMVDIFRVTLRGVLKHGFSDDAKLKIATSIFKAVHLRIIDPERYLPVAREMDEQQTCVAPTLKGGDLNED